MPSFMHSWNVNLNTGNIRSAKCTICGLSHHDWLTQNLPKCKPTPLTQTGKTIKVQLTRNTTDTQLVPGPLSKFDKWQEIALDLNQLKERIYDKERGN